MVLLQYALENEQYAILKIYFYQLLMMHCVVKAQWIHPHSVVQRSCAKYVQQEQDQLHQIQLI